MRLARALPLVIGLQLLPCAVQAHVPVTPFGGGQWFISPGGNPFLAAIHTGGLWGGTQGVEGSATFYLWALNGLTLMGAPVFQRAMGTSVSPYLALPVNVHLAGHQRYAFFLAVPNGGFTSFYHPTDFMPGSASICTAASGAHCSDAGFNGRDIDGFALEYSPPTVTPEPTSLILLGNGLGALFLLRRRRGKGTRAQRA